MSGLPNEPQPAPAFMMSPAPHRRRPSAPPSPPSTPLEGCFPHSGRVTPPPSSKTHAHTSVYPLSPPATPERATAAGAHPTKTQPDASHHRTMPPAYDHDRRRGASEMGYAHHRRTSTATILRMALAGAQRTQPPPSGGGMILTPSKAFTLFLIVLSATYLASFLPMPSTVRMAAMHPPHFRKPQGYVPPAAPRFVRGPNARSGREDLPPTTAAAAANRVAFREALARRVPPPPSEATTERVIGKTFGGRREYSQNGDFWRAHPEALHRGAYPVRRESGRSASGSAAPTSSSSSQEPPSVASHAGSDTFDRPPTGPESPEAIAAAERAAYYEREAQLARMQRIVIAHREARSRSYMPVDSSAQQSLALAEQERVFSKRRHPDASREPTSWAPARDDLD